MWNKVLISLFLLILTNYRITLSQHPFITENVENLNAIIPDFQVNENGGPYLAEQLSPSISSDGSGNFVIAWEDERNGNRDIYVQRHSSDGNALGINFKVNDDQGSSGQQYPSISADSIGNFVITWEDKRNVTGDIYAQRYSSNDSAVGTNFKVNDDSGSAWQSSPAIATGGVGNFVITWEDWRNGAGDIYAQRYSSDGSALGNNFKVNDDSGSTFQTTPFISADGSDNFIITWMDNRNFNYDIYAQRYSSDGIAIGNNFKVNDDQGNTKQQYPFISVNNIGHFVISWVDERNGIYDIYAQRYSIDGSPLDTNFVINDVQGSAFQGKPSICIDYVGNFVITWGDLRNGDSDIYAQRYSSDGSILGGNFIINDDQSVYWQRYPSISMDEVGNFVVTWDDRRNINRDIYVQRYSNGGNGLGINFIVNDDTGGAEQKTPSISTVGNNNFVITWQDDRNGDDDIYAQRYYYDGSALGINFKVNDDSSNANQGIPSIAIDSVGNFVIAWEDSRNGFTDPDIYAQRYSSSGSVLGINFKVNDDLGSTYSMYPSIATVDSGGSFVITWADWRNGWQPDIYAQRYSSDGSALGINFKVNDDQGSYDQKHPLISADASGNFVITWQDRRNGDGDIYAQRYSSDGSSLGINFKVNDDQGSAWQSFPSISTDGNGNFIISWEDFRNGNFLNIYSQRYSSDGSTLGNNFKVNDDLGSNEQFSPSISTDAIGNFVITWQDHRNWFYDIYAQRYSSDGSALGNNFMVTNTGDNHQYSPDIKLWNGRIYNVWSDNRIPGNRNDIWANVLDWLNPTEINDREPSQVSSAFILSQNYPNPFNPVTTINYSLQNKSKVKLSVFDITGREIKTLVNQSQNTGNYSVTFDASDLASGIYIYKLQAGDSSTGSGQMFEQSRKMILLR